MTGNITIVNIFKTILIIGLLSIPPWLEFRKYLKEKGIRSVFMVFLLAIYAVATYYTQNIAPFIVVVALLFLNNKRNEYNIDGYYFRRLGKSKWRVIVYSLEFKVVITIITMLIAVILESLGVKIQQQEVTKTILNAGWLKTLIYMILAVVIAPILEEFIFRHIFYRKLSSRFGKILAAVISSLLFTIPHFNIAGSPAFFGVGLFNCYLYEMFGYRAAVLNHFIFNGASALLTLIFKIYNVNIGMFI